MALNVQDALSTFRRLGLQSGDIVLLYTSGEVAHSLDGGAAAIVDAVQGIIQSSGTLVCQCRTLSTGTIFAGPVSEYVCNLHGAIKSSHPTHPVVAVGRMAAEITAGHDKCHPFGRNSPFHKLYQSNAKLLLLGVDQSTNSLIHLAEEMARLPYLDRSEPMRTTSISGSDSVVWVRKPGCQAGFSIVDDLLEENGDTMESRLGTFRVRSIGVREIIDATVGLLSIDPEALLCDTPSCDICAEARAMISAIEAERLDNEIIELTEEEERTRINVEKRLQRGRVQHFERTAGDTSLN